MKINTLINNKMLFYPLFIVFLALVVLLISKNEFQNLVLLVLTYVVTCNFTNKVNIRLGISILALMLIGIPKKSCWPWKEKESFKDGKKNKKDKRVKKKKTREMVKDSDISNMALNLKNELKTLSDLAKDPEQMSEELKKQGVKNVDMKLIKEKQDELREHMTDITPFIEKTEQLLKMFESSGLIKLVDKFSHLMPKI